MNLIQVNYTAVGVAALASFAVGFAWYGPLFGKVWMKLVGLTEADMKKGNNPLTMGKALLASLVTAYVLSHFIHYAGAYTLLNGAKTGVWAWLGFVATTGFVNTLFQGKKWQLYYIDAGYYLVSLAVMGAVLAWLW